MEVLSAENNISIGDGSSMDGDISIGDTISIDNNDDLWDQFNNFNTEDGVGDTKPSELNEDLQEEYGCSNCKTFTLMYKDGQHICGVCGIVQHKRLSHEAEYRFYGDSDNKSDLAILNFDSANSTSKVSRASAK